jgi:hypothetical protein
MSLSVVRLESRETPAVFVNPALAERFALGGSGPGATASLVRLQADETLFTDLSVRPYPGFDGDIRVASGDVTGDGVADLITAAGPGGGPHVKAFDGVSGAEVRSFYAYSPAFAGGVNIAVGDFNLDRVADIVTGAGPGGGPHVRVFDGRTLGELASFYAYDPRFAGGVSVAAGDLTLDGFADIATGAGPGGGPHVKVFDTRTGFVEIQSFFAFDATNTRGVNVALGDINLDGRADLTTAFASPVPQTRTTFLTSGTGTATLPAVVSFTQNPFLPSTFTRPLDPFADVAFAGGIRVASADVDGDNRADALFATGPGDSRLRVVLARDLLAGNLPTVGPLIGPLAGNGGLFVG